MHPDIKTYRDLTKTSKGLGVSLEIRKAIEGIGCESLMPVQEGVIPYLLGKNSDVVALAQTGTGRAAAFGLPLIQKIDVKSRIPQSLVLYPARELCPQIAGDLSDHSKYIDGLKVLPVYGGSSIDSQIRSLKRGVHIIIATPEYLSDLMERKAALLATVTNVVMDEANEMLNIGFIESINAILAGVPQGRSTLLFPATVSSEIAYISRNYLHDTKEITIGCKNESTSNVKHAVHTAHARGKYVALKRIVDYYPQIHDIVLCRTRKETQEVADKLTQEDYSADLLHGKLSQVQRDTVMQESRTRSLQILVATDVATRGLDVDDLIHAVGYRLPDDTESYTHRSGRTGRAGKTGTSIVVINLREKGKMYETERIIDKRLITGGTPTSKQICGKQFLKMVNDLEKTRVSEEDISDFMPEIYRKLEWLSKEDLIKHMISHGFNRFVDYYCNCEEVEVPIGSHNERTVKNRDGKSGRQAELGFIRFFISLGKMDNFFPHELITLLNNNTRGRMKPGRIDLMRNPSFFEVEERQAQNVVKALNRTNWSGREVTVEVAGEEALTERRGHEKRNESSDEGDKRRNTAAPAGRRDEGRAGKDGKQADTREAQRPDREERGYSAAYGPKGKDGQKQFFKNAEPDFSEEGWVRRKSKKSQG